MKAENYREKCSQFLRELIAIPSESCHEELVAQRILKEMQNLNFDEAFIDDYGNVIGRVGHGPIRVVYDGHIDTVGVGDIESWPHHPYEGKVEDGYIYGRGASDNKAATAVQVYGAHLFAKNSKLTDQFSIYVVGSIQEEDCDGLGLQYALENAIQNVDFVCLGECTENKVYRGHRGRVEMALKSTGRSCHASAPERGENAIYKINSLIHDLEKLNENLYQDPFLGKGTLAVTHIQCTTPSLCAVPDSCSVHIDRRLTFGETKEMALEQIRSIPSFKSREMELEILEYNNPSYKGMELKTEKYFPSWALEEKHPLVQAGIQAATQVLGKPVESSRWVFGTNGSSSMGKLNIPTIGFGPGMEEDSHSTNDRVKIDDLVISIDFYRLLPQAIIAIKEGGT